MRVGSSREPRGSPILVTGMPRSGTTWVARLLAEAPRTSLTGREPMNPRGRQYGLGGTLDGWARLTTPSVRQSLALRRAYAGRNPWVYSRYGSHQLAAWLPWVRLVVKDPFAVLSIPAIHQVTGAVAVVVYRHPGAALASYRRLGWAPDVCELAPIVEVLQQSGSLPGLPPPPDTGDEVSAMGWFWAALYSTALQDLSEAPGSVLVSHTELATGGARAHKALFDHLGLPWVQPRRKAATDRAAAAEVDQQALHNLHRAPAAVAEEWRASLTLDEIERIEGVTAQTREALEGSRLPLLAVP